MKKYLFCLASVVFMFLLFSSCLSLSHSSNILPSGSPRVLEEGQFALGASGGVAGGGLNITQGGSSLLFLPEIHNSDQVYFRWGVGRDSSRCTEVGLNMAFLYSKNLNLDSTNDPTTGAFSYIGGEAAFVVKRQIFVGKSVTANWGLRASVGPVFNYELSQLSTKIYMANGTVKIGVVNEFSFHTNFKHNNIYWSQAANIHVNLMFMDIITQSQIMAVIGVDFPFKVGYLLTISFFDLYFEMGFHPGLFIGNYEFFYTSIAGSFNIGVQFNFGGDKKKARLQRRRGNRA